METCGDNGGVTKAGTPCQAAASEKYDGRCFQHPPEGRELSEQERRFADQYMIDLNATQAAIRAGYSPDSAHVTGSRVLNRARVQEYLEKRKADRRKRLEVSQDRVVKEYAVIAFANLASLIDLNTMSLSILDWENLDPIEKAAVQEVSVYPTENGDRVKIKLYDKLKALSKLADHLGIADRGFRLKGADGGPLRVSEMTDREIIEEARRLQALAAEEEVED